MSDFAESVTKTSRVCSETLDRSPSYVAGSVRLKTDTHATARMLFDNIAREEEEEETTDDESDVRNLSMSNEVLEDSDEQVACSESTGPVDCNGDDVDADVDEEMSEWILCNEGRSDGYKVLDSVASSSSSWNDDVYEKPFMVGAGLVNLGNTCFFNAVMQCFTHTVLLVQGLYSYAHPTPCNYSSERFCLICALREHVELSLSSNGNSVSPYKFIDNLSYFSSSFLRYEQEDAHELLQCFLDRLESCLNSIKSKDDALPSHNFNLVKQVFGGRVISKLKCCNCNHISDTYEPSVDLSLEIEDANSLSSALESFTKVEHIEDEEMKFTCDHCKQKVSVEKQLMLDQIPPVCAFHLKRFKNDGSYVEKIDKHVEFPVELDLQPYTSGCQSNNMDSTYELYAVVVHAGFSSSSGHYYCYIRSAPDRWYKFDDRRVTCVSEAWVLSEEAYILFYAKQGTPWFSDFLETFKSSLDTNLSNTSPKSVLENVDPPNIHPFDINATQTHLPQFDEVAPLRPVSNPKKETIPLALREYGSNHRVEVEKNIPTSASKIKLETLDRVLSPPTPSASKIKPETSDRVPSPPTPSASKSQLETPDRVPSQPTPSASKIKPETPDRVLSPPISPELDFSDDEITDVVFAANPKQRKLVEKAASKRRRDNEVDDPGRLEALRRCKRMPGSRGKSLMSAMFSAGQLKNSSKSSGRY